MRHYPDPHLDVRYLGPAVEEGPLPTLLYLALSVEETLDQDPYNQPALRFLENWQGRARIFSISLPAHGPQQRATEAIAVWADRIARGEDPLAAFLESATETLLQLHERHLISWDQFCLAGLSRGALFATHLLARLPEARWLVGFAPLTDLRSTREFTYLQEHPIAARYALGLLAPALTTRCIKCFIGNCDTRVGTDAAYSFIAALVAAAQAEQIRSPKAELVLYPSIGHAGHGTPPSIFHAGADWLAAQMAHRPPTTTRCV